MRLNERNNLAGIIIALCLYMSALFAQVTVTDSLNSVPDTTQIPVTAPERSAPSTPVSDESSPLVTRVDSSTVVFHPADISAITPDSMDTLETISTDESVPNERAVQTPKPRLMAIYAGELDSFSYEQVIKEGKPNTIENPVTASILANTKKNGAKASASFEALLLVLYDELSKSADMPIVPLTELTSMLQSVNSPDEGCLSDSCQQKLAVALDVTHVLTWKLSENRGTLKITLDLKPIDGRSIGKAVIFTKGGLSGIAIKVRQACWVVNNKPVPKELITDENGFQKMLLMTDYYLGRNNTLIGAGALSAAGLAVFLMRNGHKNGPPGIGFPPDWPGEEQ